MKTKVIVLALAGLGMTAALMANGPRGGWDDQRGGPGMHQGDRPFGMQRRGGGHRKGFMRQMGRQLDLSKEQRQDIRAIFKEERQARKAQRTQRKHLGKKHGGLFGQINPETFMSADSFDKDAFKKAMIKQQALRKAEHQATRESRLEHRADLLEKIFKVLTPEQRVKLIELAKKRAQ